MMDFPGLVCLPSVGKRRNCARVKLATTKLVAFPTPLESSNQTLVYSITLNAEG
jgi:hypothetical protein